MTEPRLLHLRAEDADDVPPLSALCQDFALLAAAISWDPRARTLAMMGARFRWEAPDPPTRVAALLRVRFAERLQRRCWPTDPDAPLALLAITAEGNQLRFDFAGGAALAATVETIDLTLEDLSDPWGALARPDHGA